MANMKDIQQEIEYAARGYKVLTFERAEKLEAIHKDYLKADRCIKKLDKLGELLEKYSPDNEKAQKAVGKAQRYAYDLCWDLRAKMNDYERPESADYFPDVEEDIGLDPSMFDGSGDD